MSRGRPTTRDKGLRNGFYIELRDKPSSKPIRIMRDSHEQAMLALTQFENKIVKYLGLSKKIKIRKISAKKIGKKELAKRPLSLIMENKRLIKENLNRQRGWQVSLKEYISSNYFKSLYR